tara:strand:+ start:150 stop:1295 length:1146 start_codon:yes stop_codon:yes gene_type:complete
VVYRLGKTYVDKGGKNYPEDEFLRWVNIKGSGMLNAPGIRPLKYTSKLSENGLPAYLILVTHEKTSGTLNPWHDVVDLSNSEILYWGDAKYHEEKRIDDFAGNAALRRIYDYILGGFSELVPPILHFSKPERGIVKFNGLCALNKLDISWFDDGGHPVQNYQAKLTVLDCEKVNLNWLHSRVKCENAGKLDLHNDCPAAWKKLKKGKIDPIDIWIKSIRSKADQLPKKGSQDSRILDQLLELSSAEFEKVIVSLFEAQGEIIHHISGTRLTSDGGFDFFGIFKLPRPIGYEINFLGEIKRYSATNAVDPKSVSRLVARLSRKDYGIFVTTSYFTPQAQREVLSDAYPVHLISGGDLVSMFKHLRLVSKGRLKEDWLEAVLS